LVITRAAVIVEAVPKVRRNETPNGASLRNSLIMMDFQPSY
jgi:hypothetical protein